MEALARCMRPQGVGTESVYSNTDAARSTTSGVFDIITCGCRGALRCWRES